MHFFAAFAFNIGHVVGTKPVDPCLKKWVLGSVLLKFLAELIACPAAILVSSMKAGILSFGKHTLASCARRCGISHPPPLPSVSLTAHTTTTVKQIGEKGLSKCIILFNVTANQYQWKYIKMYYSREVIINKTSFLLPLSITTADLDSWECLTESEINEFSAQLCQSFDYIYFLPSLQANFCFLNVSGVIKVVVWWKDGEIGRGGHWNKGHLLPSSLGFFVWRDGFMK